MNHKIAVIWDLDGTLLDSYQGIIDSLSDTLAELSITTDKQMLHRDVLASSVNDYLKTIAENRNIPFAPLKARFTAINDARNLQIKPMPHAVELLADLQKAGILQFVYTHKGNSAYEILSHLGMADYFTEIITSANGFARKPDPQAVTYLMEKYALDANHSWYIGDRSLDVLCGKNAGIHSILYLITETTVTPTGMEDFVVQDLAEIKNIIL